MLVVFMLLFSITAVESLEERDGLTIGHTAFGSGARFAISVLFECSSPLPITWPFPALLLVKFSLRPKGGKSVAKSKSVVKDADSDKDSPADIILKSQSGPGRREGGEWF